MRALILFLAALPAAAQITTIQGTDAIKDSRAVINSNFAYLAGLRLLGAGAPTAVCNASVNLGAIYVQNDAGAANSSFYVCAKTGSSTYSWEGPFVSVRSLGAVSHNFLTSISSLGVPAAAQPAFSDLAGSATAAQLPAFTGGDCTASAGTVTLNCTKTNGTSFTIYATAPAPTFSTLTDAATVTWAVGGAPLANASLTFTAHSGSRTLNLTGLVDGGSYVLWVKQDSTGGEGLTLGTGCTWKVSAGGTGAVTPSVTASAEDILAFTVRGSTCYANFQKLYN